MMETTASATEKNGSKQIDSGSGLDLSDRDGRKDEMSVKVGEVIDDLIGATQEARDSELFREFLEIQGQFHTYSHWNALLIKMQRPTATRVAGYNAWQDEFNRHVKKGEKGIYIRYPETVSKCPHCEETKSQHDEDECTFDESDIEWETHRYYNTSSVFDVEQTEGEELPTLPTDAKAGEGDAPLEATLEAQESLNVTVEIVEPDEWERAGNGVCKLDDREIRVLGGRSDAALVRTTVHEYAHAILHTEGGKAENESDTAAKEVETEAVAYVVGRRFGLDMEGSGFYLASWSNDERKELKERLKRINKTSEEIIEVIEGVA